MDFPKALQCGWNVSEGEKKQTDLTSKALLLLQGIAIHSLGLCLGNYLGDVVPSALLTKHPNKWHEARNAN